MRLADRLGANIAATRRGVGLSQEEVGRRASLHRTEVGLLERGERTPRIDTVVRLAGALGVTVDHLLDGIAWEPGERTPGRFNVGRGAERAG